MKDLDSPITFGSPADWHKFQRRNQEFCSRLGSLTSAFEAAFTRTVNTNAPLDRVIFLVGRLCVEDFFELMLLASNGYGIGAFKILRGLYERAVTIAYLREHPDATDTFLNYHWIAQHKFIQALKDCYGDSINETAGVEEIERNFQKVRRQYLVPDCKSCGTQRLNHTWHRLDFVSMAKQSGSLGKLLADAYYLPLKHAHSTVEAFLSRLEERPSNSTGFNPDSQPIHADTALRIAHMVILGVLEIQEKHFKANGLLPCIETALADFGEIWPGPAKAGDAV